MGRLYLWAVYSRPLISWVFCQNEDIGQKSEGIFQKENIHSEAHGLGTK